MAASPYRCTCQPFWIYLKLDIRSPCNIPTSLCPLTVRVASPYRCTCSNRSMGGKKKNLAAPYRCTCQVPPFTIVSPPSPSPPNLALPPTPSFFSYWSSCPTSSWSSSCLSSTADPPLQTDPKWVAQLVDLYINAEFIFN